MFIFFLSTLFPAPLARTALYAKTFAPQTLIPPAPTRPGRSWKHHECGCCSCASNTAHGRCTQLCTSAHTATTAPNSDFVCQHKNKNKRPSNDGYPNKTTFTVNAKAQQRLHRTKQRTSEYSATATATATLTETSMSTGTKQVKSCPIPTRVLTLKDWSQLPDCYSQTPGGTLFSTTPGGMKLLPSLFLYSCCKNWHGVAWLFDWKWLLKCLKLFTEMQTNTRSCNSGT